MKAGTPLAHIPKYFRSELNAVRKWALVSGEATAGGVTEVSADGVDGTATEAISADDCEGAGSSFWHAAADAPITAIIAIEAK